MEGNGDGFLTRVGRVLSRNWMGFAYVAMMLAGTVALWH
jgi:hypothetical protein